MTTSRGFFCDSIGEIISIVDFLLFTINSTTEVTSLHGFSASSSRQDFFDLRRVTFFSVTNATFLMQHGEAIDSLVYYVVVTGITMGLCGKKIGRENWWCSKNLVKISIVYI